MELVPTSKMPHPQAQAEARLGASSPANNPPQLDCGGELKWLLHFVNPRIRGARTNTSVLPWLVKRASGGKEDCVETGPIDDTILPQTYLIAYVRIYRQATG